MLYEPTDAGLREQCEGLFEKAVGHHGLRAVGGASLVVRVIHSGRQAAEAIDKGLREKSSG